MKTTSDVVVIGGGIAGASVLYHLTQHGFRDVTLIEMNRLGSGTTAFTAAWVMLQEPTELKIRMSQASFEEIFVFQDEYDINFQIKGSLSINTSDKSDDELKRAELQRSLGVPTKILSSQEIKSVAPILNVSDIEIGRFCEKDGVIDANTLLYCYIKKARISGALVQEQVKATGIKVHKDKVIGVETTNGFISTPMVVNAAGIYAKQVSSWINLDIPIHNDLRHIVFTEPIPSIPDNMPLLEILNPEAIYIGATGKHADYTIGAFDTNNLEHKPNLDLLIEKHYDDLFYRVPEIANAGVINCIAGVRAHTPDGLPILGPVEEVSGYMNNCGWAGHGVMHAPIGGQLVASCITGMNKPSSIAIDPFLATRFKV